MLGVETPLHQKNVFPWEPYVDKIPAVTATRHRGTNVLYFNNSQDSNERGWYCFDKRFATTPMPPRVGCWAREPGRGTSYNIYLMSMKLDPKLFPNST